MFGNLNYDNNILKLNKSFKLINLWNSQKIKPKDRERDNKKIRDKMEDQCRSSNILINNSSRKREQK